MDKKKLQIALDGPAGAGKSTVAKAIAAQLGILYLDTGAMYRAIGLKALRAGVSPQDEAAVSALIPRTVLTVEYREGTQHTILDGEDVSSLIRTNEVSAAASGVGKWPAVRKRMVELQREIAQQQPTVLDGRDIGTYVLPDAPYKFYLTATVAERARRRYEELKGTGAETTLEEYEAQIAARDAQDMNRDFAPLRQAEDAVYIDTTGMTLEEVTERVLNVIRLDEHRQGFSAVMRGFYRFAVTLLRGFVAVISPIRVIGPDPRKFKGPRLVCANHNALWDSVVLAILLRPRKVTFMAKDSLFAWKPANWMFRALGAFPVRRGEADTAAIKKLVQDLKEGRACALFPEGTRNKKHDGSVAALHTGASLIALKAMVPVTPVYLHQGGRYRIGRPVKAYVGEPLDLSDLLGKRINGPLLKEATARLTASFEELRKKAEKDEKSS